MSGQRDEDLLTLDDVAEMLAYTRRTVERLVKAGELPVVRLSRKAIRVTRHSLHAFIAARADHFRQ